MYDQKRSSSTLGKGGGGGGINMPRSVLLFLGFNLLFFFCFYIESCIVIDKQLNVVKSDGHRARAVQLWKLCMADESLDRPSGRSDLYLVFLVIFFQTKYENTKFSKLKKKKKMQSEDFWLQKNFQIFFEKLLFAQFENDIF